MFSYCLARAAHTDRLCATVAATPQLKWWLLALGDGVEVFTPDALRRTLSESAARMMTRNAATPATNENIGA